ncbi:hypothetical protein [Carboxylicivirga marina]|uniref:hypothetical protein n=1 Tax=Carboxylicivirga marina TaxID=2800988 RepID=UPI0025945D2C|nr:hypothetical protein [uncultured Carboxylicivirga sp.]
MRKVLRVRKRIIKDGHNHVPAASEIIARMENQLNYWPYNRPETMARFITLYHNELCTIIPGGNCKAGGKYFKELSELNTKSYQILHS